MTSLRETRTLNSGTKITRYPSPLGKGHMYYTNGGPEGMVLIMDTYLIPVSVVSACLSWELDSEVQEPPLIKTPKPEFNKEGFRF